MSGVTVDPRLAIFKAATQRSTPARIAASLLGSRVVDGDVVGLADVREDVVVIGTGDEPTAVAPPPHPASSPPSTHSASRPTTSPRVRIR